ncbi:PEBP-like protein [Penicillium angulare]|uniref:PEBP-like protein n=1 Tax=Penicillium angulare TaxID=116970 RepID=A0A9W9EUT8_9EURO|nr:PEBP-like protein [Penicillium angulare]
MHKLTFAAAALAATRFASAGSLPTELTIIGEPSQVLNVTFSTSSQRVEVYPGQTLSKSQTANQPHPNLNESGSAIKQNQKYVFMMIDPDTNATDPLSVALHTIISNVSASDSKEHVVAKYVAPMPQGTSPHNYTLLLFSQPESFTIPSMYDSYLPLNLSNVLNRVNLPLRSFLNDTGLHDLVAANWFREGANTSTTATTSGSTTPTGSAAQTATSSSVASLEAVGGEAALAIVSLLGAVWMGM